MQGMSKYPTSLNILRVLAVDELTTVGGRGGGGGRDSMRDSDHKDDPDLHDRWRYGPGGGGGSCGNGHDRGGDMHGRRVEDRN